MLISPVPVYRKYYSFCLYPDQCCGAGAVAVKTGAGSSYTEALTLSLNFKAAILTSCSRSRAKMERLHNTDPVANWAKILNPDPNSIYLDPQHQCCGAGPFLTGSGSGSDQKVPAPTKKYWLRTAPAPQHCTTLLSMIHFLQNNCVLGYDSSVFKRFFNGFKNLNLQKNQRRHLPVSFIFAL